MLMLPIIPVYAQTECENPRILKELEEEISRSVEKSLDRYFYYRQKLSNPYFAEYIHEEKEKLEDMARSQKYSPEEFNQILKERIKNIYKDANSEFINIVKQQEVEEDDSTYQYNQVFEKLLEPYIDYQLSKKQKAMMREFDGAENAIFTSYFKFDPNDEKLLNDIVHRNFNVKFLEIKQLNTSNSESVHCQMTLNFNKNKQVDFKYSLFFSTTHKNLQLSPIEFYVNNRHGDFNNFGQNLIENF
ncbi:hypothetical protein [Acinetobacter shaoyimingii]|uniref:Uncharacterized protein n=1 Tax=Acinetobacter shaoyimingii TaxID=2715164 RepID=A0A6G8RXT7_9GAMM|nr:hypothetical protein [Acinetobacter shaoyimingii]NHB57526.1 hypothetical protein [Acinetobacter shaoyimingii]QIO06762.1 hypothetical protein G8E00_12825 [Acinetobacter shaoyimingii]